MVATGLTRRVSKLGRIMVPKAIRNRYGISEHSPVEIFRQGDFIVIKKFISDTEEIKSKYHTDNVGRIVLPKALRKEFALTDPDDYVEIFTENDSILLKKYEKSCLICGNFENLITVKGKKLCRECLQLAWKENGIG